MTNRLQAGIDFSQKKADFCLLFPDGQPLESHISFANSTTGYSSAKRLLLEALDTYDYSPCRFTTRAGKSPRFTSQPCHAQSPLSEMRDPAGTQHRLGNRVHIGDRAHDHRILQTIIVQARAARQDLNPGRRQ